MAARLPRLIALVALALPLPAAAQAAAQAEDGFPASQVILGETLRRAGAARLSDIIALAQRWDVETADGFRWSTSPLGGAPFLPARWTVVVDGHRMDDDLFGHSSLDRLAVPLEQVESVELVELPRLVAGRVTTGGLIRIRTADPAGGPAAVGSFTTGSEIGDPGPFAFTPSATPNVDRLGHTASAGLSYGGTGWFAGVAVAWVRMVPTDPAILGRYAAALGSVPRVRSAAPSLRIGGRLGGGRHELVVRHSDVDGALGLSPFGTEIATDERFTFVGAAGDVPLREGRRLLYDLSHARDRSRLRRGRPGPPLDWLTGTSELRVEAAKAGGVLELAGLRVRRRAVHRPSTLSEPTVALATAYAGLRLGPARAFALSGTVTAGEGDLGFATVLSRSTRLGPAATLEAVLGYERSSRGEDNSVWAWAERGHELLAESGADFTVLGEPRAPEQAGADLVLTSSAGAGVTLSARALLRRSRGLSLERRELHYLPATSSFDGPAAIVHGASGELAGASVEVAARPAPGLDARAGYWMRGAIGGDRTFRDAWAAVPVHAARATVEYAPVPGLALWMGAAFRGSARHPELAAVEREAGGRYRQRSNGAFTLDAAVRKGLWNDRLHAHFGVRNLFGAELRYHPAGATFGPTATVRLEASLP